LLDDTIVAISTPLGDGGIGIVRLSGPKAITIADTLFKGESKVKDLPSHVIHYGRIIDPGSCEVIDEILLTLMRRPKTYTREDVVEINCHGGILALRKVLELALKGGARLALPGEFTKRAFLNGRIDLAQAEAVVDVVRAKSESSLKVATHLLRGGLSEKIHSFRHTLMDILAQLEAAIDFEEEETQLMGEIDFDQKMGKVRDQIQELIETTQRGSLIREGIRTVILGRPNVGKSSLLNALIGRERAIVTPIPGTTRDTIEEMVDLEGIPLKIIDTAGIRQAKGVVEEEGVKRAFRSLDDADLIFLVLDASQPLTEEDQDITKKIGGRPTIIILNKIDLPLRIELEEVKRLLPARKIVETSAIQGAGLEEIREGVKEIFFCGGIPTGESLIITHLRHKEALEKTLLELTRAREAVQRGDSFEFIALDLREAIGSLDSITGERIDEEILERIFSQFCVGK